MAEGDDVQKLKAISRWVSVVDTGSLPDEDTNLKQLATVIMACMREDEDKLIRQMKKLIKKHKRLAFQILTTDIDGWMPLHACALRGSKNLLKVFLRSDVDINTTMCQPEGLPGNCTMLHMAALRGDVKLLEFLISKGAYLNATDSDGQKPVIYAAKRKHRRAVKLLEEHGACMTGVEELLSNNDGFDCITPQPSNKGFCFF